MQDITLTLTRAAELRRLGREDEALAALRNLYRDDDFHHAAFRLRRLALRQLLDDPALPAAGPSRALCDAMWSALGPAAALAAASRDPCDAAMLQRCRWHLARWREPPRMTG